MSSKCYDLGDYILRTSHYFVGKYMQNTLELDDWTIYKAMHRECRLNKWFGHRKSAEYRWSISDGLTKWLYDKILKYINLDPYKGANCDQYRAYFMCLYLLNDWRGALRVMIGLLLRLGFLPSLMENCLFRPQAFVLLTKVKFPFRINYLWRPVHWVCLGFFMISKYKNLKIPIKVSTTNKISLLPTMKLLKFKLPNADYIKAVYLEYYKPEYSNYFIGQELYKGVLS